MSARPAAGNLAISLLLFPDWKQSFTGGVWMTGRTAVAIPEKLFFKIGEVCELAGVQAHVLRYWESEFPMLAPQKNRAGQRVYRKRDVEIALRIKELLYEDQYTIAGAKKRLANDLRAGGKFRIVTSAEGAEASEKASAETPRSEGASSGGTAEDRRALKQVAGELRELLSLLDGQSKKSKPH